MLAHDVVAAAIERVYAAFALVRRPTAIDWCGHCRSAKDVAALLKLVPLRELPAEALRSYAASVLTTVGDMADFRYFLPRILEIACADGFPWFELDTVAARLGLAGWSSWVPEERTAIRELFHACWIATLAIRAGDAEAALRVVARVEDDLAPRFDEWTDAITHPQAARGLLDLLRYSVRVDTLRPADTDGGGYDAQLARWLTSPGLRTAVAKAFEAASAEEALSTLADIDELLSIRSPEDT